MSNETRFIELSEEFEKLFTERMTTLKKSDLTLTVFSDDTFKMTKDKMCGMVIVNSPEQRYVYAEDGIIKINDRIFEELDEHSQIIVIDKLLSQFSKDLEKDKVKKQTPDVKEHSNVISIHGYNSIASTAMAVENAYHKIKEETSGSDNKNVE